MLKPRLLTSSPVCHLRSTPSSKAVAANSGSSTDKGVPAVTFLQAENSDVSRVELLVAVEVMNCPTGTGLGRVTEKTMLPSAAVVTRIAPSKVFPSPLPEASHAGLEKNSRVKVVFGELLSWPRTTTPAPLLTAAPSEGKFCRLFGPVSGSSGSLDVTPSLFKSSPRLPLE